MRSLNGKMLVLALVLALVQTSWADLSTGLVAHYTFDGNANDASGYNHHGTAYGATLTTDRFGKADSAYSFDGLNDYVDTDAHFGGYAAFSEFAWVRADVLKSGNNFIQSSNWYQSDRLGNDGGFDLAITNGYVRSWVNESDRMAGSVLSGPYICLGEWFHVGFTWDGSTHRLYLDGVQVASQAYTGDMGTSAKTSLIGVKHYGLGLTGFFHGSIDDVRIYDRALTDGEVHDLAVVPVPGAALLGVFGLAHTAAWLRRRRS